MNCPFCDEPMEDGFLDSLFPPLWKEVSSGLPFPTSKHDIFLGKGLGLLRPKAHLCRNCRRIVVEY